MIKKLVSIVIPTYNEEDVIEKLLQSIKAQTYPEIETLIIDDDSSDNTVKIAKKYSKVYEQSHKERSVQRNFGAKKSRGEYYFFLDADMRLTKSIVKKCVEKVENYKKIGALAIPEIPVAKTFWEKVKAHEREFYNIEGDVPTDAARFFPKKVFNLLGGYDESITGPEDWDLTDRVKKKGYKVGRIKEKIYHHERVQGPFSLAKKKYYYGLKSHRYLGRHNISPFSAKTIYFLRPVFYNNWRLLVAKPVLTILMVFMLTVEQVGGGLGFLVGKARKL